MKLQKIGIQIIQRKNERVENSDNVYISAYLEKKSKKKRGYVAVLRDKKNHGIWFAGVSSFCIDWRDMFLCFDWTNLAPLCFCLLFPFIH